MKISLFIEIPVPKPWGADTEFDAFQSNLDWLEFADRLGFHAVWCTEHHFLEEYCHASAPEVFLGALSQRTSQLRLGHGIVHAPPPINHPARVAERISTLDVLSNGRVEFGTGEASSVAELDGFNVDPGKKREMWAEAVKVATRCMTETPFTGFEGEFVKMPPRNVIPKPRQKPHPPTWVACTRRSTIDMAADHAIGALSFSFIGPDECRELVAGYYSRLPDAVPLTPGINPNILFTGGDLMCAATDELAVDRLQDAGGFFGYGITYYYVWGEHRPGQVDLWAKYMGALASDGQGGGEGDEPQAPTEGGRQDWQRLGEAARENRRILGGVGSPERIRQWCRKYEEAGVDQLMFLLPPVDGELIMESLELVGKHVIPEFHERDEQRAEEKAKRLEPAIEAMESRRPHDEPPLDPAYTFGGVPVSWDQRSQATEVLDAMTQAAKLRG
ncbi:MAG: LLM class flavin-dependent oxidoreductase [Acidimicrobiales bacterium]|nr:LLM class flavin-dependent oxidoreductase [Acidimicrobiales bacterium]